MSVIGYLILCQRCEAKLVVTAEAKHSRHCPECLTESILEDVAEDYPVGEVEL